MAASQPPPKLRVLVVDDSALNRRAITRILEGSGKIVVVGHAEDGEQALRLAQQHKPEAITLDLEMPRMDGFTFLRILMTRLPTPTVIVSSYGQKHNVFRALELGAIDFVAKPDGGFGLKHDAASEEILQKVLMARSLRRLRIPAATGSTVRVPSSDRPRASSPDLSRASSPDLSRASSPDLSRASSPDLSRVSSPDLSRISWTDISTGSSHASWPDLPTVALTETGPQIPPRHVVAIAASTGGPAALIDVFKAIPEDTEAAFLVAQHMPPGFTRAFAERLNRRSPIQVVEARDGEAVLAGMGFVCPGAKCMELRATRTGSDFLIRLLDPLPTEPYVPSADRLFTSAALAVAARTTAVVLTGMGRDGMAGAKAVIDAGGQVIVESSETAVIHGMPGAVISAGLASRVLPLPQIVSLIAAAGRS